MPHGRSGTTGVSDIYTSGSFVDFDTAGWSASLLPIPTTNQTVPVSRAILPPILSVDWVLERLLGRIPNHFVLYLKLWQNYAMGMRRTYPIEVMPSTGHAQLPSSQKPA